MSKGKVGAPTKEINPEIALRIEKLRKDSNITQAELAAKVGVSRDSVRNWEHSRSEPNKEAAKKLSQVLKLTGDTYFVLRKKELLFLKHCKIIHWTNY